MALASSFEYDESSGAYEDELFALFSSSDYMEQIKAKALKGSLKTIRFRSLCWKLFLDVLPENGKEWITVTKELRNRYDMLLEKFHVDPRSENVDDVSINNPLSTSNMSPWNKYFDDQRLRQMIHQDVVRTFPDNEFFRSPEIQKMMINILFVFAREHKSIEYKQGMHELLAPILLVIHTDIQFYLKAAQTDDDLEMQVHIMLNQNYLEHDAYFMFCQTMARVEPWYIMDCNFYEQVEEMDFMPNRRRTPFPTESLPSTMHFIWFTHCKSYDPELYTHLTTLEIAPQMYGIRWLRLLFGREFVIEDLLVLWDAIFADNDEFNLYKYIFVAMLISIRHLLIRGNYTSCLSHLMHFPHVESVQFIIDLALHLRNPMHCKRPETRNKSPNLCEMQETKSTASKGFYGSTGLGRAENLLKKGFGGRPKSLNVSSSATGVHKLWRSAGKTGRSEPCGPRLEPISGRWSSERGDHFFKTYSASSRAVSSTLPYTASEKWRSEESEDHYFKKLKKDTSSTLPCTSIRNVMESQSHKYKASDLTQAPGKDSDKGKAFQEMVPLFPPISAASKTKKEIPLEIARRMQSYQAESARIKKKEEHCSRKLTYHLYKLREVIMGQKIKDEGEAVAALNGLERVRDILDNKIPFTPDSLRKFSTMEDLSKEASAMNLGIDSDDEISSAKKHQRKNSAPALFPDIQKCD